MKKLIEVLISTIAAAIVSVIVSAQGVHWLVVLFVVLVVFYTCIRIAQPVRRWFDMLSTQKRRATSVLGLGTGFLLAMMAWESKAGPYLSPWLVSDDEVRRLVQTRRWVSYNPSGFDPTTNKLPSVASLERDVISIRQAGFDGIITFTSSEPMDEVADIAERNGLLIVMGVWDPNDRKELHLAAARSEDADGYAVGHNGLDKEYSRQALREAVQFLRYRTRLPVTTTERVDVYLYDEELAELGDWLFPDAHLSLRSEGVGPGFLEFSSDPHRDVRRTIDYAQAMAEVARKHRKPVLLKMVAYPIAGVPGASREQQAQFFSVLLDHRRDIRADFPPDVFLAPHGAFDTTWKTVWPYFPWEPHTGLIERYGAPRPAVRILRERLP